MNAPIDLKRFETALDKRDIDAVIATSPDNLFYTTGLPGILPYSLANGPWIVNFHLNLLHHFCIVTREGEQCLIKPDWDHDSAEKYSWVSDQRTYPSGLYREHEPGEEYDYIAGNEYEAVKKVLEEKGLAKGNVGIEETVPLYIKEKLSKLLLDANFVGARDAFYEVRMIKSPEEIRRLELATKASEKAIARMLEEMKKGAVESELVKIIKSTLIEEGASWNHIVWSRGMDPGHPLTSYRLKEGDCINFDFGGVFEGYTTDFARVASIGEPPDWVKNVYKVQIEAEQRALESIRPGAKVSDIFNVAQETLRKGGYPKYTRRFVGHSIGVQIEERPYITDALFDPNMKGDPELLIEPNMVVVIEIPYYKAGFGMLNIEDLGVVTQKGFRVFNTMDRDIFIR